MLGAPETEERGVGKKRKGAPGARVEAARVAEIVAGLGDGTADITDAEFEAVAGHLVAERDGVAFSRLGELAGSKPRVKAYKRGAYALSQVGVRVSTEPLTGTSGERRPTAGAELGSAALPLLMSPPLRNGTRIFTFVLREGAKLTIHEAYFCVPEGLFRLRAATTTRESFLPWMRKMTHAVAGELPERVRVEQALLERKLWHIRRCTTHHRFGEEVDLELAKGLRVPGQVPPHPALALDLGGARRLTMPELCADRRRIDALLHESYTILLREHWRDCGGLVATEEVRERAMRTAVGKWLDEWNPDEAEELLLDCATFWAAFGDRDAALTFRSVVDAPSVDERRRQVADFLVGYVLYAYAEGVERARV